MSELIAVLVVGAALLLMRLVAKPRPAPAHEAYAFAVSAMGTGSSALASELHHWQALGRFDFEIVDTERHQAVLRAALAELGTTCMATLHAPKEVGARVEVRISDHRVGFLSDGDATRFQRRLAYEARPGQTSQCGARIVAADEGGRQTYAILLDLKPFRH